LSLCSPQGFLKAFFAYLVPVSLFQRSVSWPIFRRAFALGFFVGGVRLIDSVIETIKEERKNVGGMIIITKIMEVRFLVD
jgi:hypothetical protein